MSTLTTEPVASLLARLLADAEATDAKLRQRRDAIPSDQLTARMQSQTEYRELYGNMKEFYLAVSPDTARLLYVLTRSTRARAVVEFGTSFGISTIHLAAALRDNGGGQVIGTEFESEKVNRARQNLQAAGLADLVDIREGDALETLTRNLPQSIDLVLLDGAKSLYGPILSLLESRLRPGALIIADNSDYCPDYVARVRSPDGGYVSVPIADDVEVSMRA
jgi:predicted O-methyltransferase YrrM